MSARIQVGPICADDKCQHDSCYWIVWQAPWMVEMHRITTRERQ